MNMASNTLLILSVLAGCAVFGLAEVVTSEASSTDTAPAPPALKARVVCTVDGKPVEWKGSSTLGELCGGAAKVMVKNPTDASISAEVSLTVGERCSPADGKALGSAIKVDIAAQTEQEVDLSSVSTGDLTIPCGPGCVAVKVAVTSGSVNGSLARMGVFTACDVSGLNLAIETSFTNDPNKPTKVSIGQTLAEAFPTLTVTLKNKGGVEVPAMTKDLHHSLAVIFRKMAFTDDMIKAYASFDACKKMEGPVDFEACTADGTCDAATADSKAGSDPSERKKRSTSNRKKRSVDQSMLYYDYLDWAQKQEERTDANIPACFSNTFMAGDSLLANGDISLEGVIAADYSQDLDLSQVNISSKAAEFCDHNGAGKGQIVILLDPLGLIADTDYCDNAVVLDVEFDCSNMMLGSYGNCEVVVDPLTRGHTASIMLGGEVYKFDGESLHYQYDDDHSCQRMDKHIEATEQARFQLLENRFKRMANKNPNICEDVAKFDTERDNMFMKKLQDKAAEAATKDDSTAKVERKKREEERPQMTLEQLNQQLLQIQQQTSQLATMDKQVIQDMYCKIKNAISFMDSMKVPETDKLREMANNLLKQLSTALGDAIKTLVCPEPEKMDLEDGLGVMDGMDGGFNGDMSDEDMLGAVQGFIDDEIDAAESDTAKSFLNAIKAEFDKTQSSLTDLPNTDRAGKIQMILDSLAAEADKCPGQRARSMQSMQNVVVQALKTFTSFKTEDQKGGMGTGPIPQSSCGYRKLQEFLTRGGGMFINKDLKKVKNVRGDVDRAIEFAKFLKTVNEVAASAEDGSMYDTIKQTVETKMNESRTAEKDKCPKDDSLKDIYTPDDTYSIYWHVKKGVVYRGVANYLASDFQQVLNKRLVTWYPVATCYCSNCDAYFDPYNQDGDFGDMGFDDGGFGEDGFDDGWFGDGGLDNGGMTGDMTMDTSLGGTGGQLPPKK